MYLYPSKRNIQSLKVRGIQGAQVALYVGYLIFLNYFVLGLFLKVEANKPYDEFWSTMYEAADFGLNFIGLVIFHKIFKQSLVDSFKVFILGLSMLALPIFVLRLLLNVVVVHAFSYLGFSNPIVVHGVTITTMVLGIIVTYLVLVAFVRKYKLFSSVEGEGL